MLTLGRSIYTQQFHARGNHHECNRFGPWLFAVWLRADSCNSTALFACYDHVNPSENLDTTKTDTYCNAGLAFPANKNIIWALVYKYEKLGDYTRTQYPGNRRVGAGQVLSDRIRVLSGHHRRPTITWAVTDRHILGGTLSSPDSSTCESPPPTWISPNPGFPCDPDRPAGRVCRAGVSPYRENFAHYRSQRRDSGGQTRFRVQS